MIQRPFNVFYFYRISLVTHVVYYKKADLISAESLSISNREQYVCLPPLFLSHIKERELRQAVFFSSLMEHPPVMTLTPHFTLDMILSRPSQQTA